MADSAVSQTRKRSFPCLAGALFLLGCSPSRANLEGELDACADASSVASVIRSLLLNEGDRGAKIVEEFDSRRPDFAFDRERSVFVLFDPCDGSVLHEHAVRPQVYVDSGDRVLDEAVVEAVPYSWSRLFLGVDADDFQEVERRQTNSGSLFVLREAEKSTHKALEARFRDGRLAWLIRDVNAEETKAR